jgi:site-specific DNA-methyltransferase (adenine-specific)
MAVECAERRQVIKYYEAGGITIYHGDCRDVWAGIPNVDAFITDPPYGLNIGYGRSALGLRHIAGDTNTDINHWFFTEAYKKLKGSGWLAAFTGYQVFNEVSAMVTLARFEMKSVVVWDKEMPSLGEGIRNQYELIMLARKGKPAETYTGGNVWRITRSTGRPEHPHQKPIRLMKRLVEHYCPPNGLVVDPFMGSGTTLRAAKDLGMCAIGIELDERYCEIAAKRLQQEVMEFV